MKIPRRTFLRASGISLALPWLEGMASEPGSKPRGSSGATVPRRMVCICAPLGFLPENFIPAQTGRDYTLSPYLEILRDFRDDFTVVSGLMHAGMSSGLGHQASASFLTGVPGAGRPGFRNAISLDQFAAEQMGSQTRFPSLVLSSEGSGGLSWTRTGALIPADNSPSKVFARLFLESSGVESQLRRIEEGRSILDDVREQARSLEARLGREDQDKLDEYLTSVRELEQRLADDERWARTPKPKVEVEPPTDIANAADLVGRTRLLFDLTHLALRTDSTRLVTIMLPGNTMTPPIEGVNLGHHDLSHHGKDPGKLAQLRIVETEMMKTLRDLLAKLQASTEQDETLLDRTSVYLGSNLGDGSSHSTKNLPVLVAGGGFDHGRHLAFDPDNPPPLCNLYVSLLQRLGVGTDRFSTGTGTLSGLELRGV
jgi:hypothetical protein